MFRKIREFIEKLFTEDEIQEQENQEEWSASFPQTVRRLWETPLVTVLPMPFVGFSFVWPCGQWTNIFSIRNAESAIVQRGQVNVSPEQLETLLWQLESNWTWSIFSMETYYTEFVLKVILK